MIGVIPKAGQFRAVEEFFELFKTPWEFYQPGRSYQVVIATANDVDDVNAKLLIVYGADTKAIDQRFALVACGRHQDATLSDHGMLPIYCGLLTFAEPKSETICVTSNCEIAGVRINSSNRTVVRLGYDLFEEVQFLLSTGQPVENAHIPALDLHINMLRRWILAVGIPLLEIPPSPAGHSFCICLTHDIDFVGIRNHKFDHTMWGFLYRSTAGAIRNCLRGRLSLAQLLRSWRAAASLPVVYLGWARDFWDPFEWYLQVEKDLPATYFLIPFQGRSGQNVSVKHASRRAAGYDVSKLSHWTSILTKEGCELGVHGIDAWHSAEKGREELERIASIVRESSIGIRMHWLLRDENTFRMLEDAGYAYDSTIGYNDTVGYRSGTTQTFRPFESKELLELPLHIQDGALFYPQKLDLSGPEAWKCCQRLIDHARESGGVLTVLWHDRSHAPERFWGDFYAKLVQAFRSLDAWFGSAGQVVGWFRKRRGVRFEQVADADGTVHTCLAYDGGEIVPPVKIRVHGSRDGANDADSNSNFIDIPWDGNSPDKINDSLARVLACPASPYGASEENSSRGQEQQAASSLP